MSISFDNVFGIHERALGLRAQRMALIAGNLANADTPDYKARDIDFGELLGATGEAAMRLARTHGRHLGTGAGPVGTAEPRYRVPLQPALDGNTVDADVELAAFADNAIHYQATLMFLNGRLRSLTDALTGGK